jgi:hypothetical protein
MSSQLFHAWVHPSNNNDDTSSSFVQIIAGIIGSNIRTKHQPTTTVLAVCITKIIL